jgi:hypothetical protein
MIFFLLFVPRFLGATPKASGFCSPRERLLSGREPSGVKTGRWGAGISPKRWPKKMSGRKGRWAASIPLSGIVDAARVRSPVQERFEYPCSRDRALWTACRAWCPAGVAQRIRRRERVIARRLGAGSGQLSGARSGSHSRQNSLARFSREAIWFNPGRAGGKRKKQPGRDFHRSAARSPHSSSLACLSWLSGPLVAGKAAFSPASRVFWKPVFLSIRTALRPLFCPHRACSVRQS